jgi:hypothetical protein
MNTGPHAKNPGGHQSKPGLGTKQSTDGVSTLIMHNRK